MDVSGIVLKLKPDMGVVCVCVCLSFYFLFFCVVYFLFFCVVCWVPSFIVFSVTSSADVLAPDSHSYTVVCLPFLLP